MMSNKLTYKKVYVNSKFRLPQSRSSSDFVVELQENMELPQGSKMWITEVSLPTSFKTTEVNFYEYLYVMIYDNNDIFVKNFRIYLGNKIYFAEQLCFDINEGLNSNTGDLSAGGIFVYAYDATTRTVQFSVKDGLNYKIKIPTDEELANYVNGQWYSVSVPYDNRNPVSINYLLSNYVATSPLSVWTSSYLNLVPFRAVYINSPELTDHHYSAPNSYSSSIIRKILIDQQLGGVVNDAHGGVFADDFIDVGGKNLRRLSFRITNEESKTTNFYDIPIEFTLLFSSPNY